MSADAARALVRAEEALRSRGLTGARAFEVLLDAVHARLGDDVEVAPEAAQAVAQLDPEAGLDLLGLAYERFFADLFKGQRGQYFTPRPLVELLLDLAGVGKGTRVLDPTCGSGGFVVCAARRGARVRGIELDPGLVRLARLNLRLAGLPGRVDRDDFFTAEPRPVDVVVANPPFSVFVDDPSVLEGYALAEGRDRVLSDWLFVEALERWVRPGGRAAVVLPWTVLDNPSTSSLRDRIEAGWHVDSVVALPEGVFRPFGGAAGRAILLVLERGGAGFTRWAEVSDPGWDVRSRHLKATPGADLAALRAGRGWSWLPSGAWTPSAPEVAAARTVRDVAVHRDCTVRPRRDLSGPVAVAELADADRRTGELHPRMVDAAELVGVRREIETGDVLVARMRPELGNVAIVPEAEGELYGSPEWIALDVQVAPHWVLHALRTPTWRASLPLTRGQTRPRTHADGVLDSPLPWPGDVLADRVDALSRQIHDQRARLRVRLEQLQEAVDAFAAGDLDATQLEARVSELEEPDGSPDGASR